jgi:hypothetical protein
MRTFCLLVAAMVVLTACGDGDAKNLPLFELYEPEEGSPERLAYDADIVRYLGTARPVSTDELADGVTTYTFDQADGPMCMRGAQYRASVRDTGSEDLLIFLQGGGACWSDFCLAVITAPAGIPNVDALDRGLEANPFADFNVVYLPYCDGSLFSGDRDAPEDDPAKIDRGLTTRHYRGLANLSAALTMGKVRFPNPRRVVLAGSSGGGYGTILASFLVRYVYPGVSIDVVNDAGIGIAKEGDPAFIEKLIMEFGADEFVPEDCENCFESGHIIKLVEYLLERDPDLRVAAVSSWYDSVISETFLGIDPLGFQESLDVHTGALNELFPDRFRRFFYDGAGHTALLGDPTGIVGSDLINGVELPSSGLNFANLSILGLETAMVGETTLAVWLAAMMAEDDEGWVDLTAETTPPEP